MGAGDGLSQPEGRLKVLGEFPSRLSQTGRKPSKTLILPTTPRRGGKRGARRGPSGPPERANGLRHASTNCFYAQDPRGDSRWIRDRPAMGPRWIRACFAGSAVYAMRCRLGV